MDDIEASTENCYQNVIFIQWWGVGVES